MPLRPLAFTCFPAHRISLPMFSMFISLRLTNPFHLSLPPGEILPATVAIIGLAGGCSGLRLPAVDDREGRHGRGAALGCALLLLPGVEEDVRRPRVAKHEQPPQSCAAPITRILAIRWLPFASLRTSIPRFPSLGYSPKPPCPSSDHAAAGTIRFCFRPHAMPGSCRFEAPHCPDSRLCGKLRCPGPSSDPVCGCVPQTPSGPP